MTSSKPQIIRACSAQTVAIHTERLTLRQWKKKDRRPFAALCADPKVMRYFPATLNEEQANDTVDRISAMIVEYGFGFWAAELNTSGQFIGFVGLSKINEGFEFAPCVEVGWRLQRSAWGQGYATEAARACLEYGFKTLELDEIISITSTLNTPSENVMKKLGMIKAANHFFHPKVPQASPLYEHVLYRLKHSDYYHAEASPLA